ncbi:anti-sigma factor [Pseudobacillus wudalianchiensis]|uniref:Regulator of SigK n=1 Tax=Pseudobacillus wudalianchiensis TaxID=1743143 RepID=A0A1B9AT89_9BACI|nr:anti-sigma factor [Bacillus wudalianchiensis]OCA87073.1 hypothetical protein A8F95_07295 [Bacillus wudalianchiensis]
MDRECDHLLSFMADDLDQRAKKKFEQHLHHCPDCSKEYKIMTDIWHSLYLDIEEKEVPETLKSEVMAFVFDDQEKYEKTSWLARISQWMGWLSRQFSPVASITVLLLMVVSVALTISNNQLRHETIQGNLPVEVVSTFSLQAAELGNPLNTDGSAIVLQQGEEKRLVVQVDDLPELNGSEVYQVWLLRNGKRENAGIFKPNKSGEGALTYELAHDTQFDQIGITVEPDPYSTAPRGKKIVGSS